MFMFLDDCFVIMKNYQDFLYIIKMLYLPN